MQIRNEDRYRHRNHSHHNSGQKFLEIKAFTEAPTAFFIVSTDRSVCNRLVVSVTPVDSGIWRMMYGTGDWVNKEDCSEGLCPMIEILHAVVALSFTETVDINIFHFQNKRSVEEMLR